MTTKTANDSMTKAELLEVAKSLNLANVSRLNKADLIARINDAKPKPAKKEDKMPNDSKPTRFNFRAEKETARAFREANLAKVEATKPLKGVTSCIPNKGPNNITNDANELQLLARAAAAFGWGNEFCSYSQAAKNHGTLKPGATGWLVAWLPTTTKSGPNAGKVNTFETVMFAKEMFEWHTESGEPEFDNELASKKAEKKAKRQERKTAKKPAAAKPAATSDDVATLTATINALLEQNAALIAALTAKSA